MSVSTTETTSLLEESMESTTNTGKCRICWRTAYLSDLISPCVCSGSQKYTHFECLERWIIERHSDTKEICDVCQQQYKHISITQYGKTFSQWIRETEDMSSKILSTIILMSIFFYLINMGCIQFVISEGQITSIIRYIQLVLIIMFSLLFAISCIIAIYVFRLEFKEWQSTHKNTVVELIDESDCYCGQSLDSSITYRSHSSTISVDDCDDTNERQKASLIVNDSVQHYGSV
ncbi:E3 ubiquitin-protein ligase MARCHF8-like [Oppia nitens]|uniref:E3 ubiquitin-protein ligase MARCHF8-like n=1 Tax=Oppia nitens TaxID=1686743 RepID=UPI0023D9DAD4|nr:E3 ubiquitin-protein ligase MARCHF8-like [Oppia nitens]